jgi:uncharacterized FlgJ-related protein
VIDRAQHIFPGLVLFALLACTVPAHSQEVIVFSSIDEAIEMFKQEDFWGEERRGEQLGVPRIILTGINPRWRTTSQNLPVPQKKEIFYRAMLPLILHANSMVLDRRTRLLAAKEAFEAGKDIAPDDLELLRSGAVLLRAADEETAAQLGPEDDNFAAVLDEMLYKLDVIPPGLALGQAAYESGYGTSRFAVEGNALFGQWTYGGKGLVPEQQRKSLGDHRIAAFDWPFDSVRGYFINLMSHPAYEDFRRLRAEARAAGRPLKSMELADGLIRYSERGQEYVDTLKGMIRVNNLDIADNAVFRDEPMRFAVGVEDEAAAEELRRNIEAMRKSGELEEIVARMRLE